MKKYIVLLSILAMIFSVQHVNSQDLNEILNQMAGASAKASYKPEYKFDTYMQMEVSDPENQGIVYNAYLTKDGSSYAVTFTDGGANSLIIFDTETSTMLILTEAGGEKNGFAMAVDPETLSQMMPGEIEADPESDYEQFKTGKNKTILGYLCEEYLIKEDATEAHIWSSEKLGEEMELDIFKNQQIFGGAFMHATGVNGMPMEYEFKDLDTGEGGSMKVTRIDLNANKTISTSEYAVMSMGQ